MGLTLAFLVLLTSICHSKADQHPEPTGLKYKWLDRFTVSVSWEKPDTLQGSNNFGFLVNMTTGAFVPQCLETNLTSSTEILLTEEMDSDHWVCSVQIVSNCTQSKSIPATIKIYPPKPRAELVRDFKCFIQGETLNCSWIPTNSSLDLTVSYRKHGFQEESRKSLRPCSGLYSIGERKGCTLDVDEHPQDIFFLVETHTAMSTFKPLLVAYPPKLTVEEDGGDLSVNLTPPYRPHCWTFEVCYKQCNKPQLCRNTSMEKFRVPYNKCCRYEFKSKIRSVTYCFQSTVSSQFSDPVFYGTNKACDQTLIVIAVVIPIILSICVILSCYCFRKHSAILCPIIPDPSVMFKELMSGSNEHKTMPGGLYTPVPETVEPCKIILITGNSKPQENPLTC